MAKRPSLSANLKHDGKKHPLAMTEPVAAQTASEETALGNASSRSTAAGLEEMPVVAQDSLMDIVGQALTGMSVTSYVTWHQSLVFHTRLSSYLLQLAKLSQARGPPYGFNSSDTNRPDREG